MKSIPLILLLIIIGVYSSTLHVLIRNTLIAITSFAIIDILTTRFRFLRGAEESQELTEFARKYVPRARVFLSPNDKILSISMLSPRQIIVFSRLSYEFMPDIVMPALLHELGHVKHKHLLQAYILSIIEWSVIAVSSYFMKTVFGMYAGYLVGAGVSIISYLVFAWVRRRQELQADEFCALNGGGEGLIDLLQRFPQKTHGIWSEYPTNDERIEHIRMVLDELGGEGDV